MEDSVKKLRELEKTLAKEKLRNMLYREELKYYEKEVPDLKTNLNTKQLKQLEKIQEKKQKLL